LAVMAVFGSAWKPDMQVCDYTTVNGLTSGTRGY